MLDWIRRRFKDNETARWTMAYMGVGGSIIAMCMALIDYSLKHW